MDTMKIPIDTGIIGDLKKVTINTSSTKIEIEEELHHDDDVIL